MHLQGYTYIQASLETSNLQSRFTLPTFQKKVDKKAAVVKNQKG